MRIKLRYLIILSSTLFCQIAFGQKKENTPKPKIVIGIVVDQMRQDFIYKYKERFSTGGFNRLVRDGFMLDNVHINYIPSLTSPGHASIYTGATPSIHGIIGNNWYDRKSDIYLYNLTDSTTSNVGGSKKYGYVSPRNLRMNTFTDQLRLASENRSKVIAIALKDRGAVFPGGHLGEAYWLDQKTGEFMTSTYYRNELPTWVQEFNKNNFTQKYLEQDWQTLYPIETYTLSQTNYYEFSENYKGKQDPGFPYILPDLIAENGGNKLILDIPFGNNLTLDMAYAAIVGEQLGMGSEIDFLSISFSSGDKIGHRFGPNSIEIEDTYLRLDLEIEIFLNYLDQTFGNQYLLFLTSDHGVAELPEMYSQNYNNVGKLRNSTLLRGANAHIIEKYGPPFSLKKLFLNCLFILGIGVLSYFLASYIKNSQKRFYSRTLIVIVLLSFMGYIIIREYHFYRIGAKGWISHITNEQIYINHKLVSAKEKNLKKIQEDLVKYFAAIDGIKEVYLSYQIADMGNQTGIKKMLYEGFHSDISGDIAFILEPGWIVRSSHGTSHGSGYSHDSHVPLIFFGWNVPKGVNSEYSTITDIAPTICKMLDIPIPVESTGQSLLPIFNDK